MLLLWRGRNVSTGLLVLMNLLRLWLWLLLVVVVWIIWLTRSLKFDKRNIKY